MPDGIATAKAAGLHFKINAVALKDVNEERFDDLIRWTHGGGMNLTLIVTMPLGEIGADRTDQYLPLRGGFPTRQLCNLLPTTQPVTGSPALSL